MLMDAVLGRAIRQAYRNRNKAPLPSYKQWRRDDVRDAIKAYRMFQKTEVAHNVD